MKTGEEQNGRWEKVRLIWEVIDRLRGESGCPWDRKQTPESVQTYLIEEAHEAAAAVRAGDTEEAAGELGDLLFMVLFVVHLYEEQGDFQLEEVCDLIREKMIRRHPHVFGDVTVRSTQEVKDNWEKIKAGEKKSRPEQPYGGIPKSLPALMRAYRMISRMSRQEGTGWDDVEAGAEALVHKASKLGKDLTNGRDIPASVFGELFIDLVNLARIKGYRAEDSLHEALGVIDKSEGENDSEE